MTVDRAYLLSEAKRNQVLALDEVVQYGLDSFGDPDYVTVFELTPPDWYSRGVRLLARTVVECTRDALALSIAGHVARVARAAPVVVDPFAGSANTLYWLARRLDARRAIGFELDDNVFEATRRNLSIVGFEAELTHVDYHAGLSALTVAEDDFLVVFVAPPWGDALSPATGLDLGRTQPPVTAIVDHLAHTFPSRPFLLAIQIYERTRESSIDDVRSRCEWSELEVYDLDEPGRNHGVLLATLGWRPETA